MSRTKKRQRREKGERRDGDNKKHQPKKRDGDDHQQQQPQPVAAQQQEERPFDPDGTLNIARGVFDPETDGAKAKKLVEELPPEQKEKVEQLLRGDDWARERRQLLQHDDAHSTTTRLTERQQHHLQQRRARGRKKVAIHLQRLEGKRVRAAVASVQASQILQDGGASAGLLEAETDLERTSAVTQTQLKRLQPAYANDIYDLQLPQADAPYRWHCDRTGRHALLTGAAGHVALLDAHRRALVTEFHLPGERLRDAVFLHNATLFAVAQRRCVGIYDHRGAEVHQLSEHSDPRHLQFLPYHWLLASTGRAGYLKYQDTSTGQLVSQHKLGSQSATCLKQNPSNAVLLAGHCNGVVSLWSPAQSTYLAKLHCHKGAAVMDVAVDLEGRTLVTAGRDRQLKIWDLRLYRERHAYFCVAAPATTVDLSHRNLLAVGHGSHVTVWGADALQRKASGPYLHHQLGAAHDNRAAGPVETVLFRPFQDCLGIGHAAGVSSIAVPGAGEPALDTAELHPLQDNRQRQETEVRQLLDKLAPDMIALDADAVGGVEASDPATRRERLQDLQDSANSNSKNSEQTKQQRPKNKKRGRSKIQTQLRRKHKNIIDQTTLRLKEAREREIAVQQQRSGTGDGAEAQKQDAGATTGTTTTAKESAPAALKRFF